MDVRIRRLVMMGHDYDTHNRVIVMDQDEKIQLSTRTTPWATQILVIDFYGNIHGVRKCVPSPQNVVRPTGPRKEDGVRWSSTTLHYISGPGIQTELYERHDLFVLPNFQDTTPLFERIHCPTFFDSRVPVCTLSDFGIFSTACLFDSSLCTYLSILKERLAHGYPEKHENNFWKTRTLCCALRRDASVRLQACLEGRLSPPGN